MTHPIEKLLPQALQMRANYSSLNPVAGKPDPVESVENFSITSASGHQIKSRLYTSKRSDPQQKLPLVLFIHGGGFVSGDLDTHDVLARAIANKLQAIVLAVDYRLAPENPAPAGLEDCYTALQWLHDNAARLQGDNQRLFVTGDSAGGNLTGAISIVSRDRKGPALRAQWLMYPAVNLRHDTASFEKYGQTNFPTVEVVNFVRSCYVPKEMDVDDPCIALCENDLHNLPPTLVSVGSVDPLSDGCATYVEALKKADVPAELKVYANQQHGFIQFFKDKSAGHEAGEEALNDGIQFLKKYL